MLLTKDTYSRILIKDQRINIKMYSDVLYSAVTIFYTLFIILRFLYSVFFYISLFELKVIQHFKIDININFLKILF